MKIEKRCFLVVFCFCLAVLFARIFFWKNLIWGDGRYYYSILHSLYFDRDLNFENEYRHLKITEPMTSTGRLANKFSLGPAIFWLPAILVGRIFNIVFPDNGYGLVHQIPIAIVNVFYVFIGLFFLGKSLFSGFKKRLIFFMPLILLLTTNLLFYTAFDPLTSHGVSFLTACLFVYFYILLLTNIKKRRLIYLWFLWGISFGLLINTRLQDVLFIFLPFFLIWKTKKKAIPGIFIFILGAFLAFAPQLLVWKILFGSFSSPYLSFYHEGFNFLRPRVFSLLFNKNNGLFLWTPIIGIYIYGLFHLAQRKPSLGKPLFILFLIEFLFIACWQSGQGASFSTRMLISSLPLLAFGLAEFLLDILKKNSLEKLTFFFLPLLFLNIFSICLFLIIH